MIINSKSLRRAIFSSSVFILFKSVPLPFVQVSIIIYGKNDATIECNNNNNIKTAINTVEWKFVSRISQFSFMHSIIFFLLRFRRSHFLSPLFFVIKLLYVFIYRLDKTGKILKHLKVSFFLGREEEMTYKVK